MNIAESISGSNTLPNEFERLTLRRRTGCDNQK